LARLSQLCDEEVLTLTINHGDCDFVNKVLQSFMGNGAKEYNKLVLQTMIQKMCKDKIKTKLSLEEEKGCNELAEVFLKQMKLNASKMVGKEGGMRFSPRILWLLLLLYIHSPVGYNEFKKSSLEIFPSSRTLQCMKSKMMHCDGISPKMYQWYYDEVVAHLPVEAQ